MGRHPRAEIEQAFAKYKWARDEASRTGDWSIWANCFTPDAHYIEHAYGELHGREALNAFPEPFQPDGTPYAFPTWTRLVYGGSGLWKSEEDVYNPARDAGRVFKAWIKAGGKTRSGERVTMVHR